MYSDDMEDKQELFAIADNMKEKIAGARPLTASETKSLQGYFPVGLT